MTLIEEGMLAARGVVAAFLGRRNAPGYFDLSLRGLAGSFVAFLVALMINSFLPEILGWSRQPAWQSVIVVIVLFISQTGMSALALRSFGRLDGLVPYLVADNWATFFVTLLSLVIAFSGLDGDMALIFLGLLVIVVEINIARLIVTLSPLQIAAFLIAQLVGVIVGMAIVGMFVPVPVGAAL